MTTPADVPAPVTSAPVAVPAPAPASRRVRWTAYAGACSLIPYAAMKAYWSFGGTAGLPAGTTSLLDKMKDADRGREVGVLNRAFLWCYEHGIDVTIVLAALGTVLLLGLVRPWGRIFPRWVPLAAGKPVPRWLPLTPAWPAAGFLAPVFGVIAPVTAVLTAFGAAHPNTGGFAPVIFLVAYGGFGSYGLALGAAAWSYQRRTRPGRPRAARRAFRRVP
ncbi:hypothetical protein ACWGDE_14245 [Streptomyces sp. NPDC054956]